MLILACCSVILTSSFLIFNFYQGFATQVEMELKSRTEFIEKSLELEENQIEYIEQLDLTNDDIRITIIASNGSVLYDNAVINPNDLENHATRIEIKNAQEYGVGEDKRLSETIGKETYYYAVKLSNGSVFRVAKTTDSIYGIFISFLPQSIAAIIIILLACLFIAQRLTKRIIEPINNFDFTEDTQTYDELSPFIRTITAQKHQIEKVLVEVTKRSTIIEAITDNMNEGLILTNKDGVILLANKSVMKILQTDEIPINKNILEVTRNIEILEQIKTTLQGESSNMTLEINQLIYHAFFSFVDKGVLVLFLNITEKAKAEKMRREFTANVSHELKTPLTTISGFAELLVNGLVKEEDVIDVASKMKNETNRLITLIENIMWLSKLDELPNAKNFEKFNLTEVILEVVDKLEAKADKNNISIAFPKSEHSIIANKSMIFELIYNLVDNAIKYNKTNGNITIDVTIKREKTQIKISDTGIGIAPRYHNHVFERFYRVDKSRSKKIDGTGLGLSIVKHIASYHNSDVKIKSAVGKGTEISITLE